MNIYLNIFLFLDIHEKVTVQTQLIQINFDQMIHECQEVIKLLNKMGGFNTSDFEKTGCKWNTWKDWLQMKYRFIILY